MDRPESGGRRWRTAGLVVILCAALLGAGAAPAAAAPVPGDSQEVVPPEVTR